MERAVRLLRKESLTPCSPHHRFEQQPSDRLNQLVDRFLIVTAAVEKKCIGKPSDPNIMS